MAWTATLTGVTTEQANIVATVRFEDSTTNEQITLQTRANDLTPSALAAWAQKVKNALVARDSALSALESYVGQSITLT